MIHLVYYPDTDTIEVKESLADGEAIIRTLTFVKKPSFFDQKKRVQIFASIEDQGLILDLPAESVSIEYPDAIESEDSPA
jgi:hypothetical protein